MKITENKTPFFMYKEGGESRIVNSTCHDNEMEILEVVEGEVFVSIGTEIAEAKAGDILCVPPSMVFRVEAKEGYAQVRGIVFDMSVIENSMEHIDSEIFYMFGVQSKSRIVVFTPDHPIHSKLTPLINDCHFEYAEKDVCYKLPIRAGIYLIMTHLLRYYCGDKNDADRLVYHNVLRFRPVIEYLAEHFTEKTYIEQLSAMINVSPDYFTKMFKDSIGKTPIDYINAMRVNLSLLLLCSTEMSMAEIADTIGFCNPNYFHKIFKQYIGMSPLAYRKSTK